MADVISVARAQSELLEVTFTNGKVKTGKIAKPPHVLGVQMDIYILKNAEGEYIFHPSQVVYVRPLPEQNADF